MLSFFRSGLCQYVKSYCSLISIRPGNRSRFDDRSQPSNETGSGAKFVIQELHSSVVETSQLFSLQRHFYNLNFKICLPWVSIFVCKNVEITCGFAQTIFFEIIFFDKRYMVSALSNKTLISLTSDIAQNGEYHPVIKMKSSDHVTISI